MYTYPCMYLPIYVYALAGDLKKSEDVGTCVRNRLARHFP